MAAAGSVQAGASLGTRRSGWPIVEIGSAKTFNPDWRLYARSAADDKAPIVALCAALDVLKSSGLDPSVNLRVILDGEEEASSPSLVPAIDKYRDKFRADLMVILDGPIHSSGRPTVVYGARGIVTFNLIVYGPSVGVHSGNYGNWIPNPAQRLATLLTSMKNEDGRVLVRGFYDGIGPVTAEERQMLDSVPDDGEQMLRTFGVSAPERAFERLQDALQVPTLNVRGLTSAHVGAGARTIIPDRATAAIDVRLVKETRAADLIQRSARTSRRRATSWSARTPTSRCARLFPRLAQMQVSQTVTEAFRTAPSDPHTAWLASALERALAARRSSCARSAGRSRSRRSSTHWAFLQ